MSEVLPGLWIGSEKAKHSVLGKQEFFGLGFKNVLNLTESSRRHRVDLRSALIRNNGETNVALRDCDDPRANDQYKDFEDCLRFIRSKKFPKSFEFCELGIFCRDGDVASIVVLAGYFMDYLGATCQASIRHLCAKRPTANPGSYLEQLVFRELGAFHCMDAIDVPGFLNRECKFDSRLRDIKRGIFTSWVKNNPRDMKMNEIKEGLFVGDMYAAQEVVRDVGPCSECKINYVLDASDDRLYHFRRERMKDLKFLKLNLNDDSETDLKQKVAKAFEFIEEGTKGENKILVHCAAGANRSVAIVAAYLMKKEHWTVRRALWWIGRCRRQAWPQAHIMQLCEHENGLRVAAAQAQREDLKDVSDAEFTASPPRVQGLLELARLASEEVVDMTMLY
eukprot:CAMPEP_0170172122 /NCGR_PEP_ID=MMETSP0040_2-20121228/5358_1 /TAXON_ID=641309 /ORGANISM="Lotharella oceanica, Strain CCMP622" /LENGTH=392 /DNA_ID=CAMNT_0010412617 /DNA_START=173 /DNA_END=1351 /DNA_ORIENTATION=-